MNIPRKHVARIIINALLSESVSNDERFYPDEFTADLFVSFSRKTRVLLE